LDSKSWWQSKAIWGSVVSIVGAVGDMVQKGPAPDNAMVIVGALFAIYGRIVAKSTIG
jgi:hypothetical protein